MVDQFNFSLVPSVSNQDQTLLDMLKKQQLLKQQGLAMSTDPLAAYDTNSINLGLTGLDPNTTVGANQGMLSQGMDWMKQNPQLVMAGVQGLGSLLGAWQGMQGVKLAEDALDFQINAYNQQYQDQKRLTEMEIADREARRKAAAR